MQTIPDSCSPERLHTLQRIFDAVWLEVQSDDALRRGLLSVAVRSASGLLRRAETVSWN
jgi:hypothetical protein